MNHTALSVQSLTFHRRNRTIFSELSFQVVAGQFIALIGPNGTGKSTLLKCLAGILPTTKGSIYYSDLAFSTLKPSEIAKYVTYMPQSTSLETNFTVEQVVEMGRYPHKSRFGNWSQNDKDAIMNAMKQVGIYELRNRFIPSLSGGERQLVYLAKAIAQETDILLLDEPTSDLDIYYQVIVTKVIHDLVAKGKTIIAAIHDINLATRICDQCILLRDGQFIAYDTPSSILKEEHIEHTFHVKSVIYEEPLTAKKQIVPYEVIK
jgi:iron complex transport system ATP-binding protein